MRRACRVRLRSAAPPPPPRSPGQYSITPTYLRTPPCPSPCTGMEYLHKRKPMVVHRDLKSLNLLVANDLTIKVRSTRMHAGCMLPCTTHQPTTG